MEKITDNDLIKYLESEDKLEDTNEELQFKSNQLEEDPLDNFRFDENKIPDSMLQTIDDEYKNEILKNKDKLNLGIESEDLKSLYMYISGKGEKPLFIDKFTSDNEGRMKDMIYIMNLIQLSTLPMLMALQQEVRERLFKPDRLAGMDAKDLSALLNNLSKEIYLVINNSTNSIQTFNQFGSLNNEYRKLLDRLMLMPEDKIEKFIKLLNEEENE